MWQNQMGLNGKIRSQTLWSPLKSNKCNNKPISITLSLWSSLPIDQGVQVNWLGAYRGWSKLCRGGVALAGQPLF